MKRLDFRFFGIYERKMLELDIKKLEFSIDLMKKMKKI